MLLDAALNLGLGCDHRINVGFNRFGPSGGNDCHIGFLDGFDMRQSDILVHCEQNPPLCRAELDDPWVLDASFGPPVFLKVIGKTLHLIARSAQLVWPYGCSKHVLQKQDAWFTPLLVQGASVLVLWFPGVQGSLALEQALILPLLSFVVSFALVFACP